MKKCNSLGSKRDFVFIVFWLSKLCGSHYYAKWNSHPGSSEKYPWIFGGFCKLHIHYQNNMKLKLYAIVVNIIWYDILNYMILHQQLIKIWMRHEIQ